MEKRTWTVQKNDETGKWYLHFSDAVEPDSAPSAEEVLAEAKRQGLKQTSLISAAGIEKYLKKNAATGISPIPLLLELSPDFDARIVLNADKTEANLYIRKAAENPRHVDSVTVDKLLQRSNIVNLDIPKIKQTVADFENSFNMELYTLIAQGKPPKRAADKKLIAHFKQISDYEAERLTDRLKNWELRTQDVEDPTKDQEFPLSEVKTLAFVEKGDTLYKLEESAPGETGVNVYGETIPGLPGNDPFFLDLRNIIQSQNSLTAGVTGLLFIAPTNRGLKLRIVPYRDASARVAVSLDKMEASLILQSGLGAGERLSINTIKKGLNDANLLDSIPDSKITEIIEEARKKNEEAEYPILKGTPPIAPNSYKMKWEVEFKSGSNIATVENEDLILIAELLNAGENGKDVYGNIILPKNAEPVSLPTHDETVKSETNKKITKFYACASGELSRVNNKLSISSLKSIQSDIDEKTGDIIFPGSLVITGDIKDGRKVKADGELSITGHVNLALVYSENSVKLQGGINGKGRGVVWAKNTASLHYAENARIFSGNDIRITNYCFKCIVKTNGHVSLEGTPGVLLGGTISAAKGVSTQDLGAEKTIRTIISFGQDYLIKDEIEVREKEIAENNAALSEIEKKLTSGASEVNIDELRNKKVKLIKRNSALTVRIFNLKENFEFHIPSKITVKGTVYPGVVLESHGRYFEVMETKRHVFFEFDQKKGQIMCLPLEDMQEND